MGPAVDPLNDPVISRAFSQQTKIRFLRVGSSAEDIQRTLKEILTTLDQEVPQIPPTRARGLSSPAPYTRNNGSSVSVNNITSPNFERRGSEASSQQTKNFRIKGNKYHLHHHPNYYSKKHDHSTFH